MEPINTKEYDGLIFTSANAVRFLKMKNHDKSIKCFCVGNLTERSLRLKGFNNTVAASGTVNALKNIITNSEKNIKNLKLKVTKLAQGLPFGCEIESLEDGTLYYSFKMSLINI